MLHLSDGVISKRVIYVEVTLRRCIEYCIVNVIAMVLVLIAFTGVASAAVEATVDSTWTTWPSTIYYLALLQGPDSPYDDVDVNIVAVDEYTLYINGKEIGSGVYTVDPVTNRAKVDTWTVSIGGGSDIIIGVEVRNKGIGNGNGLMVDIDANTDWMGTNTRARRTHVPDESRIEYGVAWYFNSGDVTEDVGTDWYDQDVDFFLEITNYDFKHVMSGSMGNDLEYNPDPHIEIISGYPENIDIGTAPGGGIRLRRVDGENLAYEKPSEEEKLTDGDLTNGYSFNQDPIGITKYVDLQELRRVTKMILYTGGTNPNTWDRDSVRGYSAQVSLNNFRYEEVGVLHEIGVTNKDEGDYDWYAIEFSEEWARYLQFEVTEARTSTFKPNVGEIMVYGVGYVYDGSYESDWQYLGDPTSFKNIDSVIWEGTVPDGTEISVQTKTRYEVGDTIVESDWSQDHTDKVFKFDSPEPAVAFKYRVKLSTDDIDVTPELNELSITYSDTAQPVNYATAYISPSKVPMGESTDFVYALEYNLNAGQNIKSVVLSVPGESTVDSVSVYDGDAGTLVSFGTYSTTDSLYITFDTAVTNGDLLKVFFESKLLKYTHEFTGYIYNDQNNDNAGGINVWKKPDDTDNNIKYYLNVSASSIMNDVLTNVKAVPKVFTPNNDDTNDFTVIEFTLAKVASGVEIKIYDTKGMLVHKKEYSDLIPKDHFFVNKSGMADEARNLPGYWDGTDDDNDLVPPGVYIYQVIVDADSGEKIEGGTVVVAY